MRGVNPFVTAIGAGAGTILTMGAATALVSGAALSVVKKVVHHRKVRRVWRAWRAAGAESFPELEVGGCLS